MADDATRTIGAFDQVAKIGESSVGAMYRGEYHGRLSHRSELPQWPHEVDELLVRALAPNREDRYPTMRALAAAIAATDGGDVAAEMARFDPPREPPTVPVPRSEKIELGLRIGVVVLLVILGLLFAT